MTSHYRHIVLGAGGIGSAAACWLGRDGDGDVLVIEQYPLGHPLGASEDHSRIIRHAYNSPDYTALTRAAYDTWARVEQASGVRLITRTGGLMLSQGPNAEETIAGYRAACDAHGHPYEILDAASLTARWPQWRVAPDTLSLYSADSGILDIRQANAAHVALARSAGVTFLADTPVLRIESAPGRVTVITAAQVFTADTLTICAGSWTGPLLAGLGVDVPITLTAEQVTYWSTTTHLRDFAPDRFPIWVYTDDVGTFYGFPVYGEVAVKAGRDEPGRVVTQETRSWEPDLENRAQLTAFMAEHLPGALGPELATKTCVYDLTPDRNFLLDTLPGHPRITVFVGAGHAAKFASLIGRILADLAVRGETSHPIAAFRFDRPAITDPEFVPAIRLSAQPSTA
jgi:monomeric sarcosine oxidase